MTVRVKRQCSEFLSSDLNALDESATKLEDFTKAKKLELNNMRKSLMSIRNKLEEHKRKKADGKNKAKYLEVWRTAIKNTQKAYANSGMTCTFKAGSQFNDDVKREYKRLKGV